MNSNDDFERILSQSLFDSDDCEKKNEEKDSNKQIILRMKKKERVEFDELVALKFVVVGYDECKSTSDDPGSEK